MEIAIKLSLAAAFVVFVVAIVLDAWARKQLIDEVLEIAKARGPVPTQHSLQKPANDDQPVRPDQ